MKSFKETLNEININEALITFNKKSYPKFGNIVILAGGGGSGKGFIKDKLLGIEGKSLDVDALKELVMNSKDFSERIKKETGKDLSKFDLSNSNDVYDLHNIVKQYAIDHKYKNNLFKSIMISDEDRKPNIIFDVTLKDINKLYSIAKDVEVLGYKKENIHIVWVINDIKVAIDQNAKRARRVPEDVFIDTHKGAASTIKEIIDMGDKLSNYLDGDIWFAFNKAKVDTEIETSSSGGFYIKDANYVKIKEAKKKVISSKELSHKIYMKIAEYTPKKKSW